MRSAKKIGCLEGRIRDVEGPDPTPPPDAPLRVFNVAHPPILGFYWEDGPWRCLRVEERTRGFMRPIPYISASGRPLLRQNRDTDAWMTWMAKIANRIGIEPINGSIRLVFRPGVSWTFTAWREVDLRDHALLHPQDPDNAVKPTIDALQYNYLRDNEGTGAFFNDTQIVDLLIFRQEQDTKPLVDRIAVTSERRRKLKAKRLAQKEAANLCADQNDL